MTDPESLADDYLELLKGAITHTLYAEVDGGTLILREQASAERLMRLRSGTPVPAARFC